MGVWWGGQSLCSEGGQNLCSVGVWWGQSLCSVGVWWGQSSCSVGCGRVRVHVVWGRGGSEFV